MVDLCDSLEGQSYILGILSKDILGDFVGNPCSHIAAIDIDGRNLGVAFESLWLLEL